MTGAPCPSAGAPCPLNNEMRAAARAVASRLTDKGFTALFAGGCVRDWLLGHVPDDYDIATDAVPDRIREIFPSARSVGESFGVMLVRHARHTFEVATFRKDGPYHDGRRPSSVEFSDRDADAARRDFTVNGIFQDPRDDSIIDLWNGRGDLAARLIRAIGDPHARIAEDRLRMLRAVRFAARLGFTIEPATAAAITAHARELASVSAERVGEELRKMLAHPSRADAAHSCETLGLDRAVFASAAIVGELTRLRALAAQSESMTALAAWWLDRAARGGEESILQATAHARTALKLSNAETTLFEATLTARERICRDFAGYSLAARKRLAASLGFDAALDIVAAEDVYSADRWRRMADIELPSRMLPTALVNGESLLREGYRAGPSFKVLLDLAMDAQLERRIMSEAEGLALVRQSSK